jgi:hypothetical protein
MTKPWRPLALAAVLSVSVFAGAVTAQTVIVTKAPPGAAIEVVLNTATVASGTADADGNAKQLVLNLSKNVNKPEIDASIYVDVCGDKLRRVIVVERARQPLPPDTGCDRRQIIGLFLVRSVSTLIVDVGGANPTVLLRQGPFDLRKVVAWSPPTGLVVFGGGVFGTFSNASDIACGNTACSSDNSVFGYTAGVEYWVNPYISGEAAYIKPGKATAEATTDTYNFTSDLDLDMFTVAGKIGAVARRGRFYGKIGGTYQQSRFSTTQTFQDTTITVDGVTETIEGGTARLELETRGWSWFFGGGGEIWVRPAFAIFGEGGWAVLKGDPSADEEGLLDERLTYVLFGARVRIIGF